MEKNRVIKRYITRDLGILLILLAGILSSCEEFFHPDQELIIKEDDFYKNWNEYRSADGMDSTCLIRFGSTRSAPDSRFSAGAKLPAI